MLSSTDRPKRSLMVRILGNAALGSITGAALVLLGYTPQSWTIGSALAKGALLGPVMSLTLMATKSWRTDLVGYYASWILAGLIAGLALGGALALEDPTTPGLAFGFGAFLGFCSGLALGAFFRWAGTTNPVEGDRHLTRR